MRKLWEDFRSDPAGGGLAVLLPALIFCIVATQITFEIVDQAPTKKPVAEKPPASWRAVASANDIIAGLAVKYWGKPDADYGKSATASKSWPRAVVVHFSADKPAVRLIKYQHNGDAKRGGAFGYHFYVNKRGEVLQGAPLTKRTNHVKSPNHRMRRKGRSSFVASANSIGVTMVGSCGLALDCKQERLTRRQRTAGVKVVRQLLEQYKISCRNVWGHGELQRDRRPIEGLQIAKEIRSACVDSVKLAQR